MKISGKTKLKYDERLERTPVMIRKNNVAMRESNDNVDHKNVVIILIFNNTYSMLLLFFIRGWSIFMQSVIHLRLIIAEFFVRKFP